MNEVQTLFDVTLDQHYYHFVALNNSEGHALGDYWRYMGEGGCAKRSKKVYDGFEIEHRAIKDKHAYAGGTVLARVATAGGPPYIYDVFALNVRTGKCDYVVLAFPFSGLARTSVDTLAAKTRVEGGLTYQRADIGTLLKRGRMGIRQGGFRGGIMSLQVISKGDPHLSSVTLGGDDPLKSLLYEGFLQKPTEEGNEFRAEDCTVGCEVVWGSRNVRSRIWMDIFGNFRVYVHKGAWNMVMIPHLLSALDSLKCLTPISVNPLHRLSDEEEV